jgi:hypothetical protein
MPDRAPDRIGPEASASSRSAAPSPSTITDVLTPALHGLVPDAAVNDVREQHV